MMFGWSKKEKNDKKMNQAKSQLAVLSPQARGRRLSGLRKRYPRHLNIGTYDFAGELFDMDYILLYLLLMDDSAISEADLFDNPIEESVEDAVADDFAQAEGVVEAAVAVEEVEANTAEVSETSASESFASSDPVESSHVKTSNDSFDSDSGGYDGGGDSYDSGDSFDSGDSGGGDCGGD